MSYQRAAFHRDGNVMKHQDVQEQNYPDGHHVRTVTTTEWLPPSMEVPVAHPYYIMPPSMEAPAAHPYYSNFNLAFNNPPHQDLFDLGDMFQEQVPKHKSEKVAVKKHVRFEQPHHHGGRRETHEEDVNSGAEEFINRKHRAFQLSKTMSMRNP